MEIDRLEADVLLAAHRWGVGALALCWRLMFREGLLLLRRLTERCDAELARTFNSAPVIHLDQQGQVELFRR